MDDDISLILAISLHEEEVRLLIASSKGKGKEGDAMSDMETAISLYAKDLEERKQTVQDKVLAQSVARAEVTDLPVIQEFLQREIELERDREMALGLAEATADVEAAREMREKGSVADLEEALKGIEDLTTKLKRKRDEGSEEELGEGEADESGDGSRERRLSNTKVKLEDQDDDDLFIIGFRKIKDTTEGQSRLTSPNPDDAAENAIAVNNCKTTIPSYGDLERLFASGFVESISDDEEPIPGSSKPYKKHEGKTLITCTSCFTSCDENDLREAGCKHKYCVGCMKQFFTMASDSELSYPPKCCGAEIPLGLIITDMTDREADTFLSKLEEYQVVAKDRVYCSSCTTFIPHGSWSGELAFCPACFMGTCIQCKGAEHEGTDCPEDKEIAATLETAKEKGWKRCPTCHAVVDRTEGCRHMICRCRTEWCFICLKKWKTCSCDAHAEEELVRR